MASKKTSKRATPQKQGTQATTKESPQAPKTESKEAEKPAEKPAAPKPLSKKDIDSTARWVAGDLVDRMQEVSPEQVFETFGIDTSKLTDEEMQAVESRVQWLLNSMAGFYSLKKFSTDDVTKIVSKG